MRLNPVSGLARALAFGAVVLALAWASPGVAANYGTVCQNCSSAEREACARETAIQMQLSPENQVWVFDLAAEDAERFRVLGPKGDQNPGGSQPGESSPAAAHHVEAIDFTPRQRAFVSGGMQFVSDVVIPAGGQIFQVCQFLPTGELQVLTLPAPRGGEAVAEQVSVPEDMHASAYDVVGNRSAAVAIGDWWASEQPAASWVSEVSAIAENLLNTSFDSEVELLVNFSDGSRGMLVPDPFFGGWVPDFDTFRDSDHNLIPTHPENLQPGSTFQFSGDSPGEDNLQRFLNRVSLLGIPMAGPNCGSPPTDCTMAADGLSCTC